MSKREKRGRSAEAAAGEMELTEQVTVVGRHIPIAAHFEVVTTLHATAPFSVRLRLAPDAPADLDPELKARWPKPEEWAKAPERSVADRLCNLANKVLVRGVEMGAQAMGGHMMRCMGFEAELQWGPEIEAAMQTPATPGKSGLVSP